jgi:O-antigen ligase
VSFLDERQQASGPTTALVDDAPGHHRSAVDSALEPRPITVDAWSIVEVGAAVTSIFVLTQGPVYFTNLYLLRDETIGVERSNVIAMHGLVYLVVAALFVRHLTRRWRTERTVPVIALAVTAASLIFPVSAIWSVDRGSTLVHGAATTGAVLVGAWIAIRFTAVTQAWVVSAATTFGVLLSLIVVRIWPLQGVMQVEGGTGAWAGIYFNRNSLAPVAAIGVVSTLVAVVTTRRWWAVLVGLPVVLAHGVALRGADSTSASYGTVVALLAGAALPCSLVLMRRAGIRWWAPVVVGVVGLAVAAAVVRRGVNDLALGIAGPTGLNNRDALWSFVGDLIEERWLLGWGHYGVWSAPQLQARANDALSWAPPSAHNGALEVLLGLGVVLGSIVLLAVAAGVTWVACATWRGELTLTASWWAVSLVVYIAIANTTESFVCANHFLLALLVTACLAPSSPPQPSTNPSHR